MNRSFKVKGNTGTKTATAGRSTVRAARNEYRLDDLEYEFTGVHTVGHPQVAAQIISTTAPLQPGRKLFDGLEQTIDDQISNIRQSDPVATNNGKIEIEVRLMGAGGLKDLSQFRRILNWMSSRFGEPVPVKFSETAYSIPSPPPNYYVEHITRSFVNPGMPVQSYFKLKHAHPIGLPSINQYGSRLGIAIESSKYSNVDIAKVALATAAKTHAKTRWSFKINSSSAAQMNIAPSFWQRSLAVPPPTLNQEEIAYGSVDLTEMITIDTTTNSKTTVYSIEIELDDNTIKYTKSRESNVLVGASTQVRTDNYLSLSPAQLDLLDTWSKIFMTITTRSGVFMTTPERKLVEDEFTTILGVTSLAMTVNKPKDLELHDLSWLSPEESPTFMQFSNWDNNVAERVRDLSRKKIRKPLFSIPGGFYLSLKADGTRYFLLLTDKGIYLSSPLGGILTQISGVGSGHPFVRNLVAKTLLDVEVIGDIGPDGTLSKYNILVFDILVKEGVDVRNKTYTDRLRDIEFVVTMLNDPMYVNRQTVAISQADNNQTLTNANSKTYDGLFNIRAKPVYRLPDLSSAWRSAENLTADGKLYLARELAAQFFDIFGKIAQVSILSSKDKKDASIKQDTGGILWNTDGTVATPADQPYLHSEDVFGLNGYADDNFSLVRKWKYNMTIDFLVKRDPDNGNRLGLFTQKKVIAKREKGQRSAPKTQILEISMTDLIAENSGRMASWNGNAVLDDSMEDMIIEFYWGYSKEFSDYAFMKYADRFDRPSPNPPNVIKAIWNLIDNPLTLEDLQGLTLRRMNRYHNKVKQAMIAELSKDNQGMRLLDLGSGRGGDARKWQEMRKVYAVEPNMTDLRELISRSEHRESFSIPARSFVPGGNGSNSAAFYSARSQVHRRSKHFVPETPSSITVINGVAENLQLLKSKMGGISVSAVTMFNALTFFYESREKLQSLINTIKEFLSEGGHFYTIAFDGELFMNTLRKHPETYSGDDITEYETFDKIKTRNLVVEKVADASCRKIWIRISGGIVRGQYEYLINAREWPLKDFAWKRKDISMRSSSCPPRNIGFRHASSS
jgi:hypothetical protein